MFFVLFTTASSKDGWAVAAPNPMAAGWLRLSCDQGTSPAI